MPQQRASQLVQQLRDLLNARRAGELTDHQLLDRFTRLGDEDAFAALVARHGPTVLGVCRRVLQHEQDAEDAFQASFLVLASKVASIDERQLVGSWLYTVAYRIALKARAAAARRQGRERQVALSVASAGDEPDPDHVECVVDEEVNRLPEKYRVPVVLCYFGGNNYIEAARLLGCPAGTLSARLARARDLLRDRLRRRGLAFATCCLAAPLGESAAPAVPAQLADTTVQAAVLFATGRAAAGACVSIQVTALTKGVLRAMFLNKLKTAAIVLLAVVIICGVGGMLARHAAANNQAAADTAIPGAAEPLPAKALSDDLWADLASTEDTRVVRAIMAFASAPKETVAFFKQRLRPVTAEPKRLAQLITDLDSADFGKRQRATEELEYLWGYALPSLRRVTYGKPSLELRQRVAQILDKMKPDQNARGAGAAFARLMLVDSPLSEELQRAWIVNGKMGDDAELTRAKVELTRLQKELELLNSAKTPEELARLKKDLAKAKEEEMAKAKEAEKRAELEREKERIRIRDLNDREEAQRLVKETPPPQVWVRAVRAILVLEGIGTAEARQLLDVMSRGEPDALPTKEAKAALQRISDKRTP
jgi:RNA polymerase sigma factor (sigma-70 family)